MKERQRYNDLAALKGAYFITGIDTDSGKSYATGFLAQQLCILGRSVITQKFVQTGQSPSDISQDILLHRKIQGIEPLPEDIDHTTCPEIFSLPASAHLASKIDGKMVDIERIKSSTETLNRHYDVVLIEGAGGLLVPILITNKSSKFEMYTTANYIIDNGLEVFIVTSAKLGSINHTLLTLEYCRTHNIPVRGLLFNEFIQDGVYPKSDYIYQDTKKLFEDYLGNKFPDALFISVPIIELSRRKIFVGTFYSYI